MSDVYLPAGSEGGAPALDLKDYEPKIPTVSDDKSYAGVKAGTQYVDPTGTKRYKPIKDDKDYAAIDEGAQYADPEGQLRTKPKFEGIGFTAQTLYDMSVTPSEKRKALERSYPGNVKEDKEGLYVEEDGKYRRPGRGISAVTGFGAAAAAPVAGSALGALGLGAVGGPVGAVAGGATGAIAGQSINDAVLQLAGVYDRSGWDEAANLAKAGMMGSAGAGVGRGIATVVPAAKAGISSVGQMLPTVASKFLGAGPELSQARELAEKGVMVPPSAWAHEAPHLQNVVEVFDPAFRTNKPLMESATKHYEESAGKILDDLGVKREGSIVAPTADVPTVAAGEKILQKTLAESAEKDRALAEALAKRKTEMEAGAPAATAQRESLTRAAEESRQAAQALIDAGYQRIQAEAEAGFKIAKSGAGTGDLWENVGNQLIAVRRGVGERATKMYDEADQLAGAHLPETQGLSDVAAEFRDQLPGDFKAKYPDVVKKLEDLAGIKDPQTGEWIKEPVQPTFGQLHNLRSILRGNADWYTLSSDLRNGTYKYFSKAVDGALHNPAAAPELQAAAKQLDIADKFYRDNIPIFEAQQLKAVMKGLEAGEPADPANLYKALVKEGQTDLTSRVREMVGPNLWAGVKAADTETMVRAAKNLDGTVDGRKFASEVLDRQRRNMLEAVHGKEGSKQLVDQALAIERLDGRLDIPVKPTDTMTEVVARAKLAAQEAEAQGTKDPLTALTKDVQKVQREMKLEAAQDRRADPLGFLYRKSTGASFAVDKILKDEDLILAAAARFGEQSPEFNALRQVYVERVLRGTMEPGKRLEKISPEVQNLMFPGVTRGQMDTLAKEMNLLMDTRANIRGDTAGGMAAMSKVEHPVGGKLVSGVTKFLPGVNPAGRAALGKYYAMITKLMTSPATLRWIEKGLTRGTPEEQEAVRNILRQHLQKGAAMGAGAGEAAYQGQE